VVRPGRPLIRLAIAVLALGTFGRAEGQVVAPTPAPAPIPIDRKPYAIRAHVDFEPSTRIGGSGRDAILEEWAGLVRRFVGMPWALELAEGAGQLPAFSIGDLEAGPMKALAGPADKAWGIRVASLGAGFAIEGREWDAATGWLGEVHRVDVGQPGDLSRGLLRLALAMFGPTADVQESKNGGVSFLVRGASIPAATPTGAVVEVGSIFRAIRIFARPEDPPLPVKYSYFRVESMDGPIARCQIISGLRDPLTKRFARKNRLVALGIKPASAPLRLRFTLAGSKTSGEGERTPAAGYRLTARGVGASTSPFDVGTTDRDGRLVLSSGFAPGLVMLRLYAGNDEPMIDFPAMPGEAGDEREVSFEPRPLTLAFEARLDALRDEIIDLVAVRYRLESQMKRRLSAEDWDGLERSLAEFAKLTPRQSFVERLKRIEEDAQAQERDLKTLVLTKNARSELAETNSLVGSYLDDEAFRAYKDAVEQARAQLAERARESARAKKKPGPARGKQP